MWVLWLAYTAISLTFLAQTVIEQTQQTETFPRLKRADSYAVLVPDSIVDAYTAGLMTTTERQQFERDLQSGLITIPPARPLTVWTSYWPVLSGQLSNVVCLLLSPAFFLVLLQYLIIGYADPIRLARER